MSFGAPTVIDDHPGAVFPHERIVLDALDMRRVGGNEGADVALDSLPIRWLGHTAIGRGDERPQHNRQGQ